MADQGKVVITRLAGENIGFGYLVDAAGTLTTARSIGVAIDSAASGARVPIQISGTALVVAGETMATPGTLFKSNADGKAVAATVGSGDEYHLIVGQTLEAASADGVLITCKIF